MKRTRPTVARVVLAMAATSAIAGLLVALRAWWLAVALALAALSPFLEWHPVPPRLARTLTLALRLVLLLSLLLLWLSAPPEGPGDVPGRLPVIAGSLLAALACVFVLAPREFPAARCLVPALVGALAVAAAMPSPAGYGSSVVPAFRQAGHNAFAELYLALAVVVVVALWAAALVSWGPAWNSAAKGALVVSGCAALATAGVLGLPAAQPRLERMVIAALDPGPVTGLSHESELGEFEQLARSRRRVLDLHAAAPSGREWLLRSEVLTRFDGRRWSRGPALRRPLLLAPAPPFRGGPTVAGLGSWFLVPAARNPGSVRLEELRVAQAALEDWPLLLPRGLVAITADAPLLELDADGLVRSTGGELPRLYGAAVYTAKAEPPAPGSEEAAREAALVLPAELDPRLRALAGRLAPADAAAGEKVERVLRFLSEGYAYTLEPGEFRAGADPIAQFLFEKKRGYCEYFATAAALLLRLEGVPARFVKGLRAGPRNDYGGGLFVVRESDAHAWIEAWVAGRGWVEVDPTPGAPLGASDDAPGWLSRVYERARALGAEAWARLLGPGPLSLLAWVGDGILDLFRGPLRATAAVVVAALALGGRRGVAALRRWRRRRLAFRRDQPPTVPPELRQAIERLERAWRKAGHPRPASRGLREHARGLATAPGPGGAGVEADADRLIEAYYRARFGQPPRPHG